MVRSYTRSFNGFAARLSDEEQQRIASKCFMIHLLLLLFLFSVMLIKNIKESMISD